MTAHGGNPRAVNIYIVGSFVLRYKNALIRFIEM